MPRTFPIETLGSSLPVPEPHATTKRSELVQPYGGDLPEFYNRERVFGSKANLLKTLGIRESLIDQLLGGLGQSGQSDVQRQAAILGDYAKGKGGLLQQLYGENISLAGPAQGQAFLQDLEKKAAIRDLLTKLYTQGADIFGTNLTSEAAAKSIMKAKQRRKVDRIIGPLAGIPFIGGIIGGLGESAKPR